MLAMGSISVFVVADVDWYLETMLRKDVPAERLMCEWKYNAIPEPPLGVIPEQGASPIWHKGARSKP